jgi:two-component system sensor histidine kinase BaeS
VTTRRPEPGLGTRLFLAQTLTAVVAALTLWAVAAAVGPAIFHAHLHRAAGVVPAETSRHVEEAFSSASAISIGVALVASLATALAVSAYVARRIAGPVGRLARAVQELASGCYNVRVPPAALGPEFATLTGSFNEMAGRLGSIETTRRRLLADLGHEMRTPLATLDAYLDGLEDGVVALEPASLAVLRTQTRRLTRLTEDITAVSRAEEHQLDLHLRPTTVNALTAAALTAAADRFRGKGVDLIIQAVPEQLPVVVDPDRIGQVLGNLLDNALRHTPAGGQVTLRAQASGQTVTIAVSDTGEGIPAEHLPHLFERFYRVDSARDRVHGGSGIGLAIAKALVEAHGGQIAATSAGPGRGSTLQVTLPRAARARLPSSCRSPDPDVEAT